MGYYDNNIVLVTVTTNKNYSNAEAEGFGREDTCRIKALRVLVLIGRLLKFYRPPELTVC